jgi:tetratricopeptide (TPR) repeat protein
VEYLTLIDKYCGGGDAEGNGEDIDLSLWIEPANRLATLLYLMGRYEESKMWCERILDAKPWHIGALSGIVLVCIKLNDQVAVMEWALRGFPKLSKETLDDRKDWVERNVCLAEQKLLELEEASQYYKKVSIVEETFGTSDNPEDASWQ